MGFTMGFTLGEVVFYTTVTVSLDLDGTTRWCEFVAQGRDGTYANKGEWSREQFRTGPLIVKCK